MSEPTHNTPPFPPAPAPWKCKIDTYWLIYYQSLPLSPDIYAPLEADTPSFSSSSGHGGLAMIQLVRYLDSPVGRYNELVLLPGEFDVPGDARGKGKEKKLRITRIYVDQKETTYQGAGAHVILYL